jgi:hypothetical protein
MPNENNLTMHVQLLKIQEYTGNISIDAYQAALLSPYLQQRQCLQVLPRSRTLLP